MPLRKIWVEVLVDTDGFSDNDTTVTDGLNEVFRLPQGDADQFVVDWAFYGASRPVEIDRNVYEEGGAFPGAGLHSDLTVALVANASIDRVHKWARARDNDQDGWENDQEHDLLVDLADDLIGSAATARYEED